MSVETAIKECLHVAEDCKTKTGFYVFNEGLLQSLLTLAYNNGEIAGGKDAQKRLDNIIDGRMGKP